MVTETNHMNSVRAQAEELDLTDVIFFSGLDDALIGIGQQFNDHVAVYDYDRIIDLLMSMGMDSEEADEYFWYNIQGAYVGEHTPIVLHIKPVDD